MIKCYMQGCQVEEEIDEGGRFLARREGRIKKRAWGIKRTNFRDGRTNRRNERCLFLKKMSTNVDVRFREKKRLVRDGDEGLIT